jgi:diphthamide synthase (EF-2-diphthine--ammonia ligase)
MVSKTFRAAIKLSDRRAWQIAYEAGIHPNVLSKIMSGAIRTKKDDERVLRVAKVLGLEPAACFDPEGKEG